jgi:hypothetical protein
MEVIMKKKLMIIVVFTCIILTIIVLNTTNVFTAITFNNPIITDTFTADPATLVSSNGTVYIYTGHDEATSSGTGYVMNDWRCYSSTDMVN